MLKKIYLILSVAVVLWSGSALLAESPKMGGLAPDFTLKTLDDSPVQLQHVLEKGPVVLVVLRGWPGYQCPICTRQVHEFVSHAAEFTAKKVQVLMVYPGPADNLKAHAQEFLQDKSWPKEFLFVTDPDYTFTNVFDLRWNAPKETAYPSTFVIGPGGKVSFAHVSHTHGDRVSADNVLEALKDKM